MANQMFFIAIYVVSGWQFFLSNMANPSNSVSCQDLPCLLKELVMLSQHNKLSCLAGHLKLHADQVDSIINLHSARPVPSTGCFISYFSSYTCNLLLTVLF